MSKPHLRPRADGTISMEYRVPNLKATQLYGLIPARSDNWPIFVRESFSGAWQRNAPTTPTGQTNVLAFSAVYACIQLISGDISKLRLRLMEYDDDATIWEELNARNVHGNDSAQSVVAVLDKPNSYQTRIQFFASWSISMLTYGNFYGLKERSSDGTVIAQYPLDPCLVTPLVAENGDVYYQLKRDLLAKVEEGGIVPASEIIHDRRNCLFHPLVGVSPIFAAAWSAMQGRNIQQNGSDFFANMSRPSGILTAPGAISQSTADRIKKQFDEGFRGENAGKVAVVGDGLKYEAMAITAADAQAIEQLDWTARDVARAFGVPPYKLGLDENINGATLTALQQDYYSGCLQPYIEAIQILENEAFDLPPDQQTQFDIDGLFRMDPAGQAEVAATRLKSAQISPNEARQSLNLQPVEGGESPMLQEQNFSLAALAKRDARPDPFNKTPPAAPNPQQVQAENEQQAAKGRIELRRGLTKMFRECA